MVSVSSRRKPVPQTPSSEASPWSVQAATLTDRGQVRDGNEDSVYLEPSSSHEARARGLLCIVADGMGGYAAGEVASRLAVQGVRNRYYAGPSTFIVDALRTAIEATNFDVWQYSQRQPETAGMGCTLTTAVILGDDLIVGHVGDSRAYLVRNNGIAQLTKDHSWVEEQVDAGAITREQANRHPQRNVILRALGAKSAIAVDIVQEKVLDGDVIVLCSDGLSTLVSDEEIGRLAVDSSPDQAVRQLVSVANQRGAPDNVTAAVLRVHGPRRRRFIPPHKWWWPLGAAAAVLLALAIALALATRDPNPPAAGPTSALAVDPLPTSAPTAAGAIGPTQVQAVGTPAPTPSPTQQREAYVSVAAILRTKPAPSTDDSTRLATLFPMEAVTILGPSESGPVPTDETDSTWYHVTVPGRGLTGYIWAGNVKSGTPPSGPAPTVAPTIRPTTSTVAPTVRPTNSGAIATVRPTSTRP